MTSKALPVAADTCNAKSKRRCRWSPHRRRFLFGGDSGAVTPARRGLANAPGGGGRPILPLVSPESTPQPERIAEPKPAITSAAANGLSGGGARYIVGLCRRVDAERYAASPTAPRWLLHTAVDSVPAGDLAALTVAVDPADFTGARGEANLADVRWLGPRATSHEQILRAAMALGPVLPCRFGTLVADVAAAGRLVESRAGIFEHFAAVTQAADEWTVRIGYDRAAAVSAFLSVGNGGPAGGAAYLLRRKREQEAAAKLVPWLTESVRVAAAGFMLDPPAWLRAVNPGRARKGDSPLEPLLTLSIVVARDGAAGFDRALESLAAEIEPLGCQVHLDGPLPAYGLASSLVTESEPLGT